ncbi:2-oxoglutarate dehydrogenase E2 component (dihydrolipoamide succinyltransferase) [Arcticibacter tournemirensis]|uniref:Dihydrolipoamide acetyltransferase component of pyruvate dehydrogenase complex n=1 Tax=Arcticibacter tournemirensis TaxID=699437 RepID=A0A5M9HFH2_9SPHI|nr:dihydrolipoamide acetyltransferase family protein [Arcticibacter tournemirensis]KAA8483657.1 2-oxo acid dehydrogenase subunit E2 [Arcticibacter tournemirensis]TQM51384.1 2-oxoglutarate dehydrogenase E2 component (dihydrolipoamide succinyltransferase) [Arcticibacter tournemirensis]
MAHFELLLPKMGESVAEATITKWLKEPGDTIEEDEPVVEIATDKVDSEVPSPVSGKLIRQVINPDEVAYVGSVIAIIETDESTAGASQSVTEATAPGTAGIEPRSEAIPGIESLENTTESAGFRNTDQQSSRFYSPLVKSIAAEEGISADELDQISGTGAEGRVTKKDILDFIKKKHQGPVAASSKEPVSVVNTSGGVSAEQPQPAFKQAPPSVSAGDEIMEMDRMRRMIADHMVMSKHVAPHVTSFVEADVTNIVKWRERIKASFEKREGGKITFTPIFIQAVAKAIKDMPMINVSVDGTRIIKHRDINIGMAAALPSGNLIVPVIKNADQLNLVGLTRAVNDLALRARNSKLLPDEVMDGTFTLTNIGSFGNVMGIPIINQPQVAILAVGAIQKKPAVIETEYGDVIAIRHKMFLSMSYDHRVVDGALGGMFVKKVADYLESWDVNYNI